MNAYEWDRITEQFETAVSNTANALKELFSAWRKADLETSVEYTGGTEDVDDFTPSDN